MRQHGAMERRSLSRPGNTFGARGIVKVRVAIDEFEMIGELGGGGVCRGAGGLGQGERGGSEGDGEASTGCRAQPGATTKWGGDWGVEWRVESR